MYYVSLHNRGFSLVEVILAGALFVLFVTVFVSSFLYGEEATFLSGNRTQAVLLAHEGLEITRNIRDEDYANLTDGTHGLATSSGEWIFSGSSDVTGIFTREIIISSIDASRKEITSNVTWQQRPERSGTVSVVTQLTSWMEEIVSGGDWSNATTTAGFGLPSNQDGYKVRIQGDYAYVVRSGGTDFYVVDISDPANPSVEGSLGITGTTYNVDVSGDYAYVTSTSNSSELIILDISTPSSPSVHATFNDSGNHNARGVYVSGNYAYMAMQGGNDFVIVDISNPGSPSYVGGLSVSGSAREVVVSGNYAYLAGTNNSTELTVIDISTPASPSVADTLNLSGNSNALTVAVSGNYALVGQGDDVRVVDISNPLSVSQTGTIDTGGTIEDIALDFADGGDTIFVVGRDNSAEFMVIDISTPASPVLLSSIDVDSNADLNGVAYDSATDIVVAVGEDNSNEFYVFSSN